MVGCKDPFIGSFIKDLLDVETFPSLQAIFKKYDNKILEEEPMFYYKLGEQFLHERKIRAALDMMSVYEMILDDNRKSNNTGSKYTKIKQKLISDEMR